MEIVLSNSGSAGLAGVPWRAADRVDGRFGVVHPSLNEIDSCPSDSECEERISSMKVLVFCHKPPWPMVDGGTVATARMAEGLAARGVDVEVLALATPKHPGGGRGPDGIPFDSIEVDTRPRLIPALLNLLRRTPYQLQRFLSSKAVKVLKRRLRESPPDVVQIDGVGVLPYLGAIREAFGGVVIYRAHNVEHQVIRDRAAARGSPLFSGWLRLQAGRLERAEARACREVDGVVAISEAVGGWCKGWARGPVVVIGVGAPVCRKTPTRATAQDLVHLGAMDWPPNREGVLWFVREVWPELRRRHPSLEFHLGGRRSQAFGHEVAAPGVVVDGEIDSAAGYLGDHGLMVVPLLAGSGIRVKIVEGMALAKAIVASPVAVEGLAVDAGRHLLVAEHALQWIEAIERCLSDPQLVAALGAEAFSFARTQFSLPKLSKDLENFYTALATSAL